MLRGFYTAASGMLAQQRRAEILSNNMANANTPGYKAEQSVTRAFPEMLLSYIETDLNGQVKQKEIGPLHTGVYVQEVLPLYTQGDMKETNVPSDIALIEEALPIFEETNLRGALFYAVETPDGVVKYTKNGHFTLSEEGYLTIGGNNVLSTEGNPILITSTDFDVTPNGQIFINGEPTNQQIDVRFAEDIRNLVREGNGLYRTVDEAELPSAVNNEEIRYQLKQGFLEGSNVDITRSYTELLSAYRTFEANQKVLQAYDKSMDKAVNEVGRIR